MKKTGLLLTLIICSSMQIASAALISTLGERDFIDGQVIDKNVVDSAAIQMDDPVGFNEYRGDDFGFGSVNFGSFSFTHNFDASATASGDTYLTMGLFDIDAFPDNSVTGTQVNIDAIDIFFDDVKQDDTIWQGISTLNAQYNVRSMLVNKLFLMDGMLNVRIVAVSSGTPTLFMPTSGNGFSVDFAELSNKAGTTMVSEPNTFIFIMLSVFLLLGLRLKN